MATKAARMATKAAHKGECQWCASRQKLPGGVLAKHGYTVRHGWFSGVCSGAGEAPYELSCDLIQRSIDWARERRAAVAAQQSAVLAIDPKTTDKTWMHVYHRELSSRTRGSVYLWEHGTLVQKEGHSEYFHNFRVDDSGKVVDTSTGLLAEKVKDGNKAFAKHLGQQLKEIDQYIEQQQRRVSAWTLKPLEAL